MTIFKGDNLQAFNGKPVKIDFNADFTISKAAFVINNGIIVKEFVNPVFPVYVELDEQDTAKLSKNNQAQLIIWDEYGKKKTCKTVVNFSASEEVYHE